MRVFLISHLGSAMVVHIFDLGSAIDDIFLRSPPRPLPRLPEPFRAHPRLPRSPPARSLRQIDRRMCGACRSGGARGPPEAPCAVQQCGNGAPAPLVSVSTNFPIKLG